MQKSPLKTVRYNFFSSKINNSMHGGTRGSCINIHIDRRRSILFSCAIMWIIYQIVLFSILVKLKKHVYSGLFDQIIHSNENVDIVGLFKHLHPKVILDVVIHYKRYVSVST